MDNFITILKTVFLGIVEGITEWLPISSTGHMILVDELLHMNMRKEFMDIFFVIIQLGAIFAVIILFWSKIWPFHTKKTAVKPYFEGEKIGSIGRVCNSYIYMDKIIIWIKILIASLPAAVIGLLFDDQIDSMLTGDMRAFVVASTLIIYGVLFIVIESLKKRESVLATDDMSYKMAFLIGVIQCLAIVPGTSRSGTTILGAVLLGATRTVAAEFSFFLSIPAMLGASAIKLLMFFAEGNFITPYEITILLIGCIVAFAVSVLAIKFLLSFIQKHDFKAFGYYRIVLGAIVLAYFLCDNNGIG
ncbi:MAG: undecaprenyl-diphosphate phosphatase [Acutalibacteraceae bacterium]|nr:undecaprenyl-diphosphate phosphatase [Acutalibacteraceae bacterium]